MLGRGHDRTHILVGAGRLFETEIRGVPMLQRLCDAIFAADGTKPAVGDVATRPHEVGART